jgi:hypothetical protein
MFRWALSQDIVDSDPTSGLGTYDPGTPRDRVLTAEEMLVWVLAGRRHQGAKDSKTLGRKRGRLCSRAAT